MFGIGTSELIVIGIIILLLFGAKSIPEIARSIAQGLKIFKKELNADPDTEKDSKKNSVDEK